MSTHSDDGKDLVVGRNNDIRDVLTVLLQQNIPGINAMVISKQLIENVKKVVLKNMDKIMAALGGSLIAIGSGVLIPSILITVINVVGFTSGGVAAGSLAALIQGSVYGAWTGGIFASLQSIGATAVIAPPVAIALAATAVVVGGGAIGYAVYQRKKRRALLESSEATQPEMTTSETTSLIPYK